MSAVIKRYTDYTLRGRSRRGQRRDPQYGPPSTHEWDLSHDRWRALYENLSANGRLRKPGVPTFYFGTPLTSPKVIDLESWNFVRW